MAKNIMIYKGTIKTLYANDFHLNQDNKIDTELKTQLVTDEGLFYYFMGKYINIDYGTYLPDYEEAYAYLNSSVSRNEEDLINILNNPEIDAKEKDLAKYLLTRKSSCTYADYSSLEKSHTVPKKEFKMLKKKGIKS